MSRSIVVEHSEGNHNTYPLSIAVVEIDENDIIKSIEVNPYKEEIQGVEYYDGPIHLKVGKKFRI